MNGELDRFDDRKVTRLVSDHCEVLPGSALQSYPSVPDNLREQLRCEIRERRGVPGRQVERIRGRLDPVMGFGGSQVLVSDRADVASVRCQSGAALFRDSGKTEELIETVGSRRSFLVTAQPIEKRVGRKRSNPQEWVGCNAERGQQLRR